VWRKLRDDDIFDEHHKERKQETTEIKKPSRRLQLFIGLGIFILVGVLIAFALTGVIDVIDLEPFDSSQCDYGVKSNLFGQSCITEEEYIEINKFEEVKDQPSQTQTQTPFIERGSYKEVASTFGQVVDKTVTPSGYYVITSRDSWYGDFIDGNKIPKKIDLNQNTRVNFKCFTDEHLATSVYFGTFRNNLENDLLVEVYIDGLEIKSKSTDRNSALILEGSCYGHES